ncbi:uncharacterized protein B0T23DRAFT_315278, partial [Neurospora hispaniola]
VANRNLESPSPKSVSSPKGGISPEDHQDRNPPKKLQRTDADESDPEVISNGNYISDDKISPTPINDYNSPEPQRPSTLAKTLPSIEDNHHPGYTEGNVPPLERIGDTIVNTIEGDPNVISSEYLEPTTDGHYTSSTHATQRFRELTVEDDENESTLPHAASSPSPSPIQPQDPSPSPSLLLAELPYLSPTPASSATASSTPPASSRVNSRPASIRFLILRR